MRFQLKHASLDDPSVLGACILRWTGRTNPVARRASPGQSGEQSAAQGQAKIDLQLVKRHQLSLVQAAQSAEKMPSKKL